MVPVSQVRKLSLRLRGLFFLIPKAGTCLQSQTSEQTPGTEGHHVPLDKKAQATHTLPMNFAAAQEASLS